MKKTITMFSIVLLVFTLLTSCIQYQIIWPFPDKDRPSTPSEENVIQDPTSVPGLQPIESLTTSSIARANLVSAKSGIQHSQAMNFVLEDYPVDNYGTIQEGFLSLFFEGTITDTKFTADTISVNLEDTVIARIGETSVDTVTITDLRGPVSSTLTIIDGSISAIDFTSFSLVRAITSNTEISMNGSTIANSDIAENNNESGFGSGFGSESYPYIINTADQLFNFAESVNSGEMDTHGLFFELGANIDLNNREWDPIGYQVATKDPYGIKEEPDFIVFNGSFDGKNHTISNLFIDLGGGQGEFLNIELCHAGLFGAIGKGATIKNLTIHNANITADSFIGTFVGYVPNSADEERTNISLDNLHVTGDLQINASTNAGGIAGRNEAAGTTIEITNCSVDVNEGSYIREIGTENVSTNFFGGLIGVAYSNELNKIENCSVDGNIRGGRMVGGICGVGDQVTNCHVSGIVRSTHSSDERVAAGIVGVTQQDISYCVVEGAQIRGIDGNSNKVSGIATFRGGTAAISNCAVINTAISSGGHAVFGPNVDSGTVTSTNNKYWKITYLDMTENNAYVPAGNAQDGEAFASAPVQADFEAMGYDFTTVWKWNDRNGAPELQNVGCTDDVVVEEKVAE